MSPTLFLVALLVLHGAIHLLGFVRGFDLGNVPLQKAIGPVEGLLWLLAALLLVGAGVMLLRSPRGWWIPALAGILLSQALVLGTWSEARWGTAANLLLLIPILLAATESRP